MIISNKSSRLLFTFINRTTLKNNSICLINSKLSKQFNVNLLNIHQTSQLQSFAFLSNSLYNLKAHLKENTFSGSELQECSVYLLKSGLDDLDYLKWFEFFELKDTISSWFQITILHLWMIMVKISDGSKKSDYLKKQIVLRLWEDLQHRIKLLGIFPVKERNQFMNDCHNVFSAALLSYDEGLLGSDQELAASLWRIFYEFESVNYEKLEILVKYVRCQTQHLANLKKETFFTTGSFKWKTFNFDSHQ